jgi:hypothetical protein
MGKGREPQIILKTDRRNFLLEMGGEGKFTAKSSGWHENRLFLEDDKLEVAVKNGRWMMTHLPAGRRQNRRQSNTTSRFTEGFDTRDLREAKALLAELAS